MMSCSPSPTRPGGQRHAARGIVMRVSALNVNSMHCPALREGRAPIPRPGYQEAVGCEEVSNQGQVFEAHEQGGNRRAIACVISGIEGRKQVRAAAPALLGESSEKTCRSLAGGPTLRLPQRSYNQMKCLAPAREAASRLRGVCCCFADLFGRYCTQYMVGMKHMPALTCKSLFFSARFLLHLGLTLTLALYPSLNPGP